MSGSQASPFAKARSTRAHEQIVEQLQQLILSGKLATGGRLPSERAMMAEFQVSRPTVREALRVAESMGLISVRPGDPGGPKVLGTPSLGITRVFDSLLQAGGTSVLDLLEMRIVLDSSAAALASLQPRERTGHGSPRRQTAEELAGSSGGAAKPVTVVPVPQERLAHLSEVLGQMQTTTDLDVFAELDADFHEAVIVASGNRLFHLVFQALNQPIRALIQSSLESPEGQSREETLRQHGEIVDAIQKSDAHRAASAVRKHLCEFYFAFLSGEDRRRIKAFSKAMEELA